MSGIRPMNGSTRSAYDETWQSRLANESWPLIARPSPSRPMRKGLKSRKQPATILKSFPLQSLRAPTLQGTVTKCTTSKAPRQNRPQCGSPTSDASSERRASLRKVFADETADETRSFEQEQSSSQRGCTDGRHRSPGDSIVHGP